MQTHWRFFPLNFKLLYFYLIYKKYFKKTEGGDLPEAVADGLNEAYGLNWRKESTKICVLISDGTSFI